MPAGKVEDVLIASGAALMVSEKAALVVWEAESCTCAVKPKLPAAEGVPETAPVELSVTPAGSVPAVKDQLYGGVPPVAARVWE